MMLAAQETDAVYDPVGWNVFAAVAGIHGPAYHAGRAGCTEVFCYGTIGGYTTVGHELYDLIDTFEKVIIVSHPYTD